MYNPVSTYRIQFHKGFTFSDFKKIIPYLAKLGVKTIYASPIFEAVPGSMHGYDITNPLNINPEIGTLAQLKSLSKKLKKLGIGWLQDIVPNHMAFHPNNKWLMDVLENGRQSAYTEVFDILWDSPVQGGKLMVPFLGKPLDEAIAACELKIVNEDKPVLDYSGQHYPLSKVSYQNNSGWIKSVNADNNLLKEVLDEQHYQLCFWQETDKQINFRRFFTVNGLICLNMQDKNVFDRYHVLIKQLVSEGVFQGLRVDHIDGLYDPKTYLERLRHLAGDNAYIIVEKILGKDENFPTDWPVQGNSGYDFLSTINNLFTCLEHRPVFSKFYKKINPDRNPLHEQIYQKKQLILDASMQGELDNLYRLFSDLKLADDNETQNINPDLFKRAIAGILVHCPVYRFYGNTMPLNKPESEALHEFITAVAESSPELGSVIDVLNNCLLHKPRFSDEDYRGRALRFYQRLMQFTGPLMAKGVEDTLMYTYNRFIDHNEVGDSPNSFGLKSKEFDEMMQRRWQMWPLSVNASSTHDTKRGEDARARLNVLSDLAEEWVEQVEEWQQTNASLKTADMPDANDEYFIYQTITGGHPMPGQPNDDFENRFGEYLVKALREAKRNSNWSEPNAAYEAATQKFALSLLNAKNDFGKSFGKFHQAVSDFGIINSLAQTLLKYTCPGMPDLYQGSELWDLSMVDPDNRRPVDFALRSKHFDEQSDWQRLWNDRYNGRIKQSLIAKLLHARCIDPETFSAGEYIPLKIKGKYKDNIFGFARQYKGKWYLVAIPLHLARMVKSADHIRRIDWKDTRVLLPEAAPLSWKNLLTGQEDYAQKHIAIQQLFSELPVALVRLQHSENDRGAGVLLHITSLPTTFAIGDIGPQAYKFADFLYQSRQKYWQMLPVNPIDGGAGYSPYSATSAMAGNALLISPELLVNDGLLTQNDLEVHMIQTDKVVFEKATSIKKSLFDLAYLKFLNSADKRHFETFKRSEAWWLDDFALYQYLKDRFNGQPWYKWPHQYKLRHKAALQDIGGEISIDRIKWLQYVFNTQWSSLRLRCKKKGITLFGDMPFYISYDSTDVWANPELFKLTNNRQIKGIAGVPPDYFSETGQLWGMPVYNWEEMKAKAYDWWIKRIKRNLKFFDLIRLDHFRAFSEYWEVPVGSKNAINGKWKPGPGPDFFNLLKTELGELPFVAEDLGDINDQVYQLRDAFSLPGMRVLQFAFDDAMPVSEHIPHNYLPSSFAYTGTHDNNTIKGWYEHDIDGKTRKRLQQYTVGKKVTSKNVHEVLMKLCYASVAKTVIIPMQDILGFDQSARMNVPSATDGNWRWKLAEGTMTKKVQNFLRNLCIDYNR